MAGRGERDWVRGAQAGSVSDLEALFRAHLGGAFLNGGTGDDVLDARDPRTLCALGSKKPPFCGNFVNGSYGDDRIVARDGNVDHIRCGPGVDAATVDAQDRVEAGCERVRARP